MSRQAFQKGTQGTTGGFQKQEGMETRKMKGLLWGDQVRGRYPQGEG